MVRPRLPRIGRAVLLHRGGSRRRGSLAVLPGALACALLVAACAGWSASPDLVLGLRNDTGSPVLVYVNDGWVGTVPAGATSERIPSSGHGGPPYRVEVRLASGTTLASLDVPAAAAGSPAPGATPAGTTATLPCGVIELVVGGLPPAPASASAGGAAPPAKACE
jgi:hypothetical protein